VVALVVLVLGVGVTLTHVLRGDDRPTSVGGHHTRVTTTGAVSAPSSSTSSPTTGQGPRIETASSWYFGRPFETIHIDGRYHGVGASTELRVQLQQANGWRQFPLPVVTDGSGRFRAFVELGQGQYRLRLVDPAGGRASPVVTLQLF